MSVAKLQRLLRMLELLRSSDAYDVDALAKKFDVQRRTIFRDFDMLREAGFPVLFDPLRRGYAIETDKLPPLDGLTLGEATAVTLLCSEVGRRCQLPFYEEAHSGAQKLLASLPANVRKRVQDIASVVRIDLEAVNPLNRRKKIYDRLVEALRERKTVKIRYRSFTEDETFVTVLHPYRLLFQRRSWYVIGRSRKHRAVRTFNVGRIDRLRVLPQDARVPRRFSLESHLRNAWRILPENGEDSTVLIRFRKMVAGNVAEVVWHPTQHLQRLKSGDLLFQVQVSGIEEISWWILGYGHQAEVIKPQALRDLIARRVDEMQRIYGNGGR